MPGSARQYDMVDTNHSCDTTTWTDEHSLNVNIQGNLAHRVGDKQESHTLPSGDTCVSHQLTLDSYENENVFINGAAAGRVGDTYGSEVITTGASTVFINGPDPTL